MRIICATTIAIASIAGIGPLPCSAATTVIRPDPAQPIIPHAARALPAQGQDGAPDQGFRPGTLSFYGIPAPVPETALWALLVGGFAMIGAKLRRRPVHSGRNSL